MEEGEWGDMMVIDTEDRNVTSPDAHDANENHG